MDNLTSWNTTLTQSKTLKTVSSDTKVTYQVTSEGGGGVVSARDFVYGSKSLVSGNKMIIGGLSVIVDDQPEVKGIVRAVHGPGCQMVIDIGDSDKYEQSIYFVRNFKMAFSGVSLCGSWTATTKG